MRGFLSYQIAMQVLAGTSNQLCLTPINKQSGHRLKCHRSCHQSEFHKRDHLLSVNNSHLRGNFFSGIFFSFVWAALRFETTPPDSVGMSLIQASTFRNVMGVRFSEGLSFSCRIEGFPGSTTEQTEQPSINAGV